MTCYLDYETAQWNGSVPDKWLILRLVVRFFARSVPRVEASEEGHDQEDIIAPSGDDSATFVREVHRFASRLPEYRFENSALWSENIQKETDVKILTNLVYLLRREVQARRRLELSDKLRKDFEGDTFNEPNISLRDAAKSTGEDGVIIPVGPSEDTPDA